MVEIGFPRASWWTVVPDCCWFKAFGLVFSQLPYCKVGGNEHICLHSKLCAKQRYNIAEGAER